MAIGKDLEKKLNKIYEASSKIELTYKGNDLTVITNDQGEAITLYIGKRKPNGSITGERYSRRITRGEDGGIVKSHWDNKGKVSGFKN